MTDFRFKNANPTVNVWRENLEEALSVNGRRRGQKITNQLVKTHPSKQMAPHSRCNRGGGGYIPFSIGGPPWQGPARGQLPLRFPRVQGGQAGPYLNLLVRS